MSHKTLKHNLLKCLEVLDRVSDTRSGNEKLRLLNEVKGQEHEETMKNILKYSYDSRYTYKIGKARLKNVDDLPITHTVSKWDNIFELLDYLNSAKGITNELMGEVVTFFSNESVIPLRDLYTKMILKDLRAGVTDKTANKVWDGLIPQFNLQLARKYEDRADKILGKEIVITPKFDGIRCAVAIDERGFYETLTRQNQLIEGLVIEYDLNEISSNFPNLLLDGELVYNGKEDLSSAERYRKTVEIVNSDMDIKENITYYVFDAVDLEEFNKGKTNEKYNARRKILEEFCEGCQHIKPTPVLYQGTDHDKVVELLDTAIANDEEGVMINLANAPYDCKRSNNLLKVKKMYTMDLPIIGYEEGTGKYEGQLGSIIVDYKGNKVGVGSGFNDVHREQYWKDREQLLGKIAEVQYFEESKNNDGGVSLRFPIFKQLRDDKKEVSYD